jgi:hypothetical protein
MRIVDAQKELSEKRTTVLEGVNIAENYLGRLFADAA